MWKYGKQKTSYNHYVTVFVGIKMGQENDAIHLSFISYYLQQESWKWHTVLFSFSHFKQYAKIDTYLIVIGIRNMVWSVAFHVPYKLINYTLRKITIFPAADGMRCMVSITHSIFLTTQMVWEKFVCGAVSLNPKTKLNAKRIELVHGSTWRAS